MQTFTYYVHTKSNLGRTMFEMIVVCVNNSFILSCNYKHVAVISPDVMLNHMYFVYKCLYNF